MLKKTCIDKNLLKSFDFWYGRDTKEWNPELIYFSTTLPTLGSNEQGLQNINGFSSS